jgi:hypothetical protein
MKNLLKSSLALALVLLGTTAAAHASVPEIDPSTGIAGLTLIAGATAILRSRKR